MSSSELVTLFLCVGTGFVFAGILSNVYQMVMNSPAQFNTKDERLPAVVFAAVTAVIAGPVILMRNAVRGRIIEQRPLGWLMITTVLASMWSCCSGILLLSFILGVA